MSGRTYNAISGKRPHLKQSSSSSGVPQRLFDTNVLLWYLAGDKRLTQEARESIEAQSGRKYISIVSAWEVAIKISLGKLRFDGGAALFWSTFIEGGFEGLSVSIESVELVESLQYHHKDPFDRLLMATALAHNLELIATDEAFPQYSSYMQSRREESRTQDVH